MRAKTEVVVSGSELSLACDVVQVAHHVMSSNEQVRICMQETACLQDIKNLKKKRERERERERE